MTDDQLDENLKPDLDDHENIQQFVCFKLADEEYAIDINLIQEVVHIVNITPIPQMPDFCQGVINSRGSVIPLFDLRKKFGLAHQEVNEDTSVLVASVEGTTISIIVDEVLDNVRFDSRNIDPAPSVAMSIERECVQGLGEMEGRMIIILDLIKLHEFIMSDINEFNGEVIDPIEKV